MGHDDFDDAPPPDEQAEDFANFDPERYLQNRNAGRYGDPAEPEEDSQPGSQPSEPDDFSKFNPSEYLQKRSGERGRPYLSQSPYEREAAYTGRSRRRARADRSDPTSARIREIDKQIVPERRGCLGRLFNFSETVGLYREILTEAGPLVKIIGCVLIIAAGAICVIGATALSVLTRR